jgi:hypothetical protein
VPNWLQQQGFSSGSTADPTAYETVETVTSPHPRTVKGRLRPPGMTSRSKGTHYEDSATSMITQSIDAGSTLLACYCVLSAAALQQ